MPSAARPARAGLPAIAAVVALGLCSGAALTACSGSSSDGPTVQGGTTSVASSGASGATSDSSSSGTSGSATSSTTGSTPGSTSDTSGGASAGSGTGGASGSSSGSGGRSGTPTPTVSGGLGKDASFKFTVPTGWQDVTAQVGSNPQIQVAYAARAASHNFRINVNVTETTSAYDGTADQAAKVNIDNQQQAGATIATLADITLDGEKTVGFRMVRTASGTKLAQTQYFTVHHDRLYIVTMSSAPQDVARAATYLQGVIRSWTWTS